MNNKYLVTILYLGLIGFFYLAEKITVISETRAEVEAIILCIKIGNEGKQLA